MYLREKKYSRQSIYRPMNTDITRGMEVLPAGIKYYSRINNITRGNEIVLNEVLPAGIKYYSRINNITRGNEIVLLAE